MVFRTVLVRDPGLGFTRAKLLVGRAMLAALSLERSETQLPKQRPARSHDALFCMHGLVQREQKELIET